MAEKEIREGARIWMERLHQYGAVESVDGRRVEIVAEDSQSYTMAIDSGELTRAPYEQGDRVTTTDRMENRITGVVERSVTSARLPTYVVSWSDNTRSSVNERALRPAPITDPLDRMRAGQLSEFFEFNLRSVAADLWARNHSEELVSLSHARVDLKPHQVGVLHQVVSNTPHRFLLCDEVGLGKTIEAAMVIKELRARGSAQRVLILTPASIQRQWQYELKTKFNETFSIINRATSHNLRLDGHDNPWTVYSSVITSQNYASYSDDRIAEIAAVPWDLIVVDEAHHARRQRNGKRISSTRLFNLVRKLTAESGQERRAVLFLTATPMQLDYHELFSLVELLNPTLFASEDEFRTHVDSRASLVRLISELEARNPTGDELKKYWVRSAVWLEGGRPTEGELTPDTALDLIERLRSSHRLREVMLRNRRAAVGGFMKRHATQWEVELTEQEAVALAAMEAVIQQGFAAADSLAGRRATSVGFLMTTYQKLAASSSRALLRSLERRRERLLHQEDKDHSVAEAEEQLDDDGEAADVVKDLYAAFSDEADRIGEVIDLLRDIPLDTKADVLAERLDHLRRESGNDKIIIFTQFRETQEMLRELLTQHGWQCDLFHGQMEESEKNLAIESFRDSDRQRVLISTEAGGEGRNLQFAHIVVNYDLPWNPMKVEQRIGRVDRIGQTREVLIFNFRVLDTIEERVLEVLHDRIGLFEHAVGGLESILGDVENDIRKALREGADKRDAALEALGETKQRELEAARRADDELKQLYLDSQAYSRKISELIGRSEASTVPQLHVDRLMQELLLSVKSSIKTQVNGHTLPKGEKSVWFHPPFTEEERGLLDGNERRKVCFDPAINVDASDVEYFGFGHPVVDRIVHRTIDEGTLGAASVRWLSTESIPTLRSGWQFNWRIKLPGLDPREWIYAVFVGDDGVSDVELGAQLLTYSRHFSEESAPGQQRLQPDERALDALDAAFDVAEDLALARSDVIERTHRERARTDFEINEERTRRLYDYKEREAEDSLRAAQTTFDRLQASSDPNDRRVLPIWEDKVRRVVGQIEFLQAEREQALKLLQDTRDPNVEYSLLNLARIEVVG